VNGQQSDEPLPQRDGSTFEVIGSDPGDDRIPVHRRIPTAVEWVALVVAAALVGWYVGQLRSTDVSAPQPRALLSIETLTGGAARPPSHEATPRLSGYLIVDDLAPGQVVLSVSWGGTENPVPVANSTIEVTLETTVDCRKIGASPATFPTIVATLRNADGSASPLQVTPLSIARWGNVFTSCADPLHPETTNSL